MSKIKFTSNSLDDTKRITLEILEHATKKHKGKNALVLALVGELGASKTQMAKFVGEVLGVSQNITSPTFVLMNHYKTQDVIFSDFYHFDCYRTVSSKEILNLGWKDIISNPKNLVLVEWAEKVKEIFPKNVIWVKIKHIDENRRLFTIL